MLSTIGIILFVVFALYVANWSDEQIYGTAEQRKERRKRALDKIK